jgi:hypothetical protein
MTAPVTEFIDRLLELVRAGHIMIGAIHDPANMTFDGAGRLTCPFCGGLVAAMVMAATHAETDEMVGGVKLIAACAHADLLDDICRSVELEVETGSRLPKRLPTSDP